MPMSWKSLELLRQNLGGVGEGVTAYLKNRQEDEERNQNFEALKQFGATPEAAKMGFNPGLAPLAFQAAGYRAFPALSGMAQMAKSTAPERHVSAGKTGVDVTTFPLGSGTPEFQHFDRPGADPILNQPDISGNDMYLIEADRQLREERKGKPNEAIAPTTTEKVQRALKLQQEAAQAKMQYGAGVRTQEDIGKETRQKKEKAGVAASTFQQNQDLHTKNDTRLGYIDWLLGMQPVFQDNDPNKEIIDYQDAQGNKGHIHTSEVPRTRAQRQALEKEREDLKKANQKIEQENADLKGKATADEEGWTTHPSGYQVRVKPGNR